MERQIVQKVVRHDHEMLGLQSIPDRRDEGAVKIEEMRLGGGPELSAEGVGVAGAQAEFRELELKQPQQLPHIFGGRHRHHLEALAPRTHA